jgi:hypothetical protein
VSAGHRDDPIAVVLLVTFAVLVVRGWFKS